MIFGDLNLGIDEFFVGMTGSSDGKGSEIFG